MSVNKRVAIIGSGPAGFYTADHLLKATDPICEVDMFDRLPLPFGLVRYGVAPDHQKIKNVTRQFDKIASNERFRFFGNVEYGTHLRLADLRHYYHAICFATGAQTDRRLGIPGEDLPGSHAATEFVAWYNGHPDFKHLDFDMDAESVAVIGVGNVAVDVARILCRTEAELRRTDIADYALERLLDSKIKTVHMIGRRGPAQAAFTNAEVKELGEMEGADIVVRSDEVQLDELSRADLEASGDKKLERKIEIVQSFDRPPSGKSRQLSLRFLLSPTELIGTDSVQGMRLVRNKLERSGDRLRAVPTNHFEDLDVQLVFRSVGYRGVPLPELPFDESTGTIGNVGGRVLDENRGLVGVYVSGWIKRGPTGVIGTNKPDGVETAKAIIEDLRAGATFEPDEPTADAAAVAVTAAQPNHVTYDEWRRIDGVEIERAAGTERPRVKCITAAEVLELLGRS